MVSKKSIISASAFVSVGQVASLAIRLIANVVMTRLLLPDAYGLVAISMGIFVALVMLSDVGINVSVIKHKKELSRDFLDTAWTMQVLRNSFLALINLVLAGILFLVADLKLVSGDTVFSDPRLSEVVAVTSLIIFVAGFKSINIFTNERNLDFGRITAMTVLVQLLAFPLTIVMALNGFGVWSLILTNLSVELLTVIASHVYLKGGRCRFRLDKAIASDILKFGSWLLLSSAFGFLLLSGDRFFVASVVTVTELGIFSIAKLWVTCLESLVSRVCVSVGLPLVSALFRDGITDAALKKFYKIRLYFDLLVLSAAFALFFSAESFVRFFYTDVYIAAGPIMAILCFGMLKHLINLNSRSLLAQGKSKTFTMITVTSGLIFLTTVPLGYMLWGLNGMVWMISLSGVTNVIVTLLFVRKEIPLNWLMELRPIVLALPAAGIGYVCFLIFDFVASDLLGGDIENLLTGVKAMLGL